jgi:hypothetical protein
MISRMRPRETLFERHLKRPLDDGLRDELSREAYERCRASGIPAQFGWHEEGSVFSVQTPLASFHAWFTSETVRVWAELSLAARLFATESNRRRAVATIEAIADRLGL